MMWTPSVPGSTRKLIKQSEHLNKLPEQNCSIWEKKYKTLSLVRALYIIRIVYKFNTVLIKIRGFFSAHLG